MGPPSRAIPWYNNAVPPMRSGLAKLTETVGWRIDVTYPKTPGNSCGATSLAVRCRCGGAGRIHCLARVLSTRGELTGNW